MPERPSETVARLPICPIHVGRDAEIAMVRSAIDSDASGVILVLGDAGMGKSRLAAEASRCTSSRDRVVLRGECSERAQTGYAPVTAALRRPTRMLDPESLRELFGGSALLAVALLPEVAEALQVTLPTSSVERQHLCTAVSCLLRRLGAGRPVLLVVEDIHWADSDTLELLAHLARAARELDITMLLTARSDELDRGGEVLRCLVALRELGVLAEVVLRPLDHAGVAMMVGALLEGAANEQLIDVALDRTHGNPFFVEELCAAVVQAGPPRSDLAGEPEAAQRATDLARSVLPLSLQEAVLSRLRALDTETVRIVRLAAAAGEQVNRRLVAVASGVEIDDADAALDRGVECGILADTHDEGVIRRAFRHALTREVLLADRSASELRADHRCIADALQSVWGRELDVVAADLCRHYLEADEPRHAFDFALDAARYAARTLAPNEMLAHFRVALRLADEIGADTLPVLLESANLFFHFAGPTQALAFAEQARAVARHRGDAVGEARAVWHVARDRHYAGHAQEAALLSEEALALCSGRDDATEAMAIEMLAFTLMASGRAERVPALVERGLPLARASGTHFGAAALEFVRAQTAPSHEEFVAASERALREARATGDAWIELTVLHDVGWVAALHGMVDFARSWALGAHALVELVPWQRGADALLAFIDALRGDLTQAQQRVEEMPAEHVEPRIVYRLIALATLVEVHLRRGDLAAARRACDGSEYGVTTGARGRMLAQALRVEMALGCDGVDARIDQALEDSGSPWAFHTVSPDIARHLARRGDAARLARLAMRVEAATTWWPHQLAARDFCLGLHALSCGDVAAAASALQASGDRFATLPMPARQAEALIGLASAVAASGERRRPAATLHQARRVANGAGAHALVNEAAAALRGLGVRLDHMTARTIDVDVLSEREIEVAALVAHGCTNAEIAGHLFLSPRTAANHVSRLLAGLHLRNRSELARWALERGLGEVAEQPTIGEHRREAYTTAAR